MVRYRPGLRHCRFRRTAGCPGGLDGADVRAAPGFAPSGRTGRRLDLPGFPPTQQFAGGSRLCARGGVPRPGTHIPPGGRRRERTPSYAAAASRRRHRSWLAVRAARADEHRPAQFVAGGIYDQRRPRPRARAGLYSPRPAGCAWARHGPTAALACPRYSRGRWFDSWKSRSCGGPSGLRFTDCSTKFEASMKCLRAGWSVP